MRPNPGSAIERNIFGEIENRRRRAVGVDRSGRESASGRYRELEEDVRCEIERRRRGGRERGRDADGKRNVREFTERRAVRRVREGGGEKSVRRWWFSTGRRRGFDGRRVRVRRSRGRDEGVRGREIGELSVLDWYFREWTRRGRGDWVAVSKRRERV